MTTLQIVIAEHSHPVVISFKGSIDSLTAEEVTNAFNAQIGQGACTLVADFADVVYTSSAGLRSLLLALKETRRSGGDVRLAALQPSVRKVLSLAGLTSIVQIFDSVEEARASYGSRPAASAAAA